MKTLSLSLIIPIFLFLSAVSAQEHIVTELEIRIENEGWDLIGDLVLPSDQAPLPAVLMLHGAARDRTIYEELARHLADRNIASLRLDLRGHGESINLGKFIPGEQPRSPLIWDSEVDVVAACKYLKNHTAIDSHRIGVVGASYSGEEMAEAARLSDYTQAYVALSPGSFTDASIAGIDSSGVPWLFVVSRNERHLKEITASVQAISQTVEIIIFPGTEHADRLLNRHQGLAERIAVWLSQKLQ
jgi:dienelactone hydrolase